MVQFKPNQAKEKSKRLHWSVAISWGESRKTRQHIWPPVYLKCQSNPSKCAGDILWRQTKGCLQRMDILIFPHLSTNQVLDNTGHGLPLTLCESPTAVYTSDNLTALTLKLCNDFAIVICSHWIVTHSVNPVSIIWWFNVHVVQQYAALSVVWLTLSTDWSQNEIWITLVRTVETPLPQRRWEEGRLKVPYWGSKWILLITESPDNLEHKVVWW